MSIQTEIDRIAAAKSALSTWLTAQSVTVPSGAKIEALVALLDNIETGVGGGGGGNKVATGTFTCSSNGGRVLTITFAEPLDSEPSMILFHETTNDYITTSRVKAAFGSTSPLLFAGSSGATHYSVQISGSTSSSSFFSTRPITNTYTMINTGYPCIRAATRDGFAAYAGSTSYLLYGTYQYVAICT